MEISSQRRARKWMSHVLEQCRQRIGRLPFVTFSICVIAISFQCVPDLGGQISFDRSAITLEYWRLFTGHLAHWNANHMAWDVFMFALLLAN